MSVTAERGQQYVDTTYGDTNKSNYVANPKADTFSGRLTQAGFDPKKYKLSKEEDWLGPEFEKHYAAMRERYPLLTSLLLRPEAKDNANLMDIYKTNKYARLADAYNAGYRYKQTTQMGGMSGHGSYESTSDNWEPVNKIETQDQKQMELLRQGQGKLQDYNKEEESYYQREYLKRKLDEMDILTKQGYEQQFFNANEDMRRTKELFNLWKDQSLYEFQKTLDGLGIPAMQAARIKRMIDAGNYVEAMMEMEAMQLTPMAVEQYMQNHFAGSIIQRMRAGATPQEVFNDLGKMKGYALIGSLEGLLNTAERYPLTKDLANAVRDAISAAGGITEFAAKHWQGIGIAILAAGMAQTAGGAILSILSAIPK